MKKKIAMLCALGLTVGSLAGCGQNNKNVPAATEAAPVVEEAVAPEPEEVSEPEEVEEETEEESEVEETETEEDDDYEEVAPDYPTLPLPAYEYTGDDPYAGVITEYILNDQAQFFGDCDLFMLTPVIVKEDTEDEKDIKVYGSFWVDCFKLFNTTLESTAGGENTGVFHIDNTGDTPFITAFDKVGDGEDYQKDIEKYFGVEDGLIEKLSTEYTNLDSYRQDTLSNYVNSNGLYIVQFQDFGHEAIPIPNAPMPTDEELQVHYTSPVGYTIDFRLDYMTYASLGDDQDMYGGITGVTDDALMTLTKWTDKTLDQVKEEIKAELKDYEYEETEGSMFGSIEAATTDFVTKPAKDGDTVMQYSIVEMEDGTVFSFCAQNTFYEDDEKGMLSSDIIGEMVNSISIP
jgi:hypothetical protein